MTPDEVIKVLEGRLALAKDSLERIKEWKDNFATEMHYEENQKGTEEIINAFSTAIALIQNYQELSRWGI